MSLTIAEAKVRERDGVAIIDLSGDINAAAEQVLAKAFDDAIASSPRAICLNFVAADYINSTGIALIVGLLARARAEHRAVSACGLTEHYQHIFKITRLADFMPMFPDEASAISDASKN